MEPVEALKFYDSGLIELAGAQGAILVCPTLQGRIFCRLGNTLLHRLDLELLARPLPDQFNNLGGNSLWPAPEGGPYAFCYPPGVDQWRVPPAIAEGHYQVLSKSALGATIGKVVALENRRGARAAFQFRRAVELVAPPACAAGTNLQALSYVCEDSITPLGEYPQEDVLIAPWSLEQFPGGDEVTAFVKTPRPREAANFDFYGRPEDPGVCRGNCLSIPLGGKTKWQAGFAVSSEPELLGALDRRRELLLLRQTARQDGIYFNIADNDQPRGPFSAADMYSVFNGGPQGFFELETIAPLRLRGSLLATSMLVSKTTFLQGAVDELRACLQARWGLAVA